MTGNHNGQNLTAATGIGVSCGSTKPREVKTILGQGGQDTRTEKVAGEAQGLMQGQAVLPQEAGDRG